MVLFPSSDTQNALNRPLELPCGIVLKNRLVKTAMSDALGDGCGNATQRQARLYERWASGGVALSIIGEVQVDPRYPEGPGNLVMLSSADQKKLEVLAREGSRHGTKLWPQLGHAGALACGALSHRKGPSAINIGGLHCEEMSVAEIHELPERYAHAVRIAKKAGFGGVQIHAGHGFLLSQFLCPLFNRRTDEYGGSVEARFSIIAKILAAVRKAAGPDFPVGIKINSTDNLEGGFTEKDALEVVRMLNKTTVDLIEISGGTYFPGAASGSDNVVTGKPYYIEFARCAKMETSVPVVVTGGFKKLQQVLEAVSYDGIDMIGMGRAMALNPRLARDWMESRGADPKFPVFEKKLPGGVTAWYSMLLEALSVDNEHNYRPDIQDAVKIFKKRDTERYKNWLRSFHSH
ncbi:oxidoreductase [Pantoea agglomerans]|nr:tRNA-dihydrouridine synthase [Pantoea agglomerans]PEI05548.1 oxidoreductase [Pantoea agglomerans]